MPKHVLRPPSTSDLERLYWELARIGAPSVGRRVAWNHTPQTREDLLALAGEMLRFEPRLLSVLLELVLKQWRAFNPLALRDAMGETTYPQSLCVVLDFVRDAGGEAELTYYVDYVSRGWRRVEPAERFFLDTARPGSRMAARSQGRNLRPYARWGFIGLERPTTDARTKRLVGRYDATTRRRILNELLARQPSLQMAEYLEAVDHSVTRQQALADIHAHPDLTAAGRGRGARWVRRLP